LFSDDLDEELEARLAVERAVETAMAVDGFDLHYQPLYARDGYRLVGFEALARLPTAGGGFIPPAEFIPAAERIGAIDRIGQWVLETACMVAVNWPEPLTVAVNLSPLQFVEGGVSETVAAALAKSSLAPGRLHLEVAESVLLHDNAAVMRELGRLKTLGVAVVIDDFGTGYSSLRYLWRFPFDKIKIDASFMRGVEAGDESAAKIVRSIVALGHNLGMTVCMEGVESPAQAEFTRTVNCDEVQGFHFGRPAPAADLAAIILTDFSRSTETDQTAQRLASA
jgi:EAL domain-containing protein (putative c-di-GMP-specific phosphodiesterase class I)